MSIFKDLEETIKVNGGNTMNIKELNGRALKKAFGAKFARFRWHNKNNSGGNFGIDLRGINGKNYEITGMHDTTGLVGNLKFGFMHQIGERVSARSFEEMKSQILSILKMGVT